MSGKIMGAVWDGNLPQNEKYVLLAYADHADHEGEGVFPSIGLVAWKTGYSDRSVIRLKQKLIKREILEQTGVKDSGTQIYKINVHNIPLLPKRIKNHSKDSLSPPPDKLSPPPDTIVSPPPDTIVSPEPSLTVKEPTTTTKKPSEVKNPKTSQTKYHSEITNAIIQTCKLTPRFLNEGSKTFIDLKQSAETLCGWSITKNELIGEFVNWWWGDTPPTPKQIVDNWAQFDASRRKTQINGAKNGKQNKIPTAIIGQSTEPAVWDILKDGNYRL